MDKKKGVNETKDALENSKEESNQSTDGSIQYISENNNDTPVTYDILDHTVKNSMRKQEATILTDLQKEFVVKMWNMRESDTETENDFMKEEIWVNYYVRSLYTYR